MSDIVIVALVSGGISGAVALVAKLFDVLVSRRKVQADAASLEESVNEKVWGRAQSELARMQKEIEDLRSTDKALLADNAALKEDNATLRTENESLRRDNAEIVSINEELRLENERLMAWAQQLVGQLYGAHLDPIPIPQRQTINKGG